MGKQILIIFVGCTFFLFSGYYSEQDGGKYYYAFDEKVPLTGLKTKAVICFRQSIEKDLVTTKLRSIDPGFEQEWRTTKTLVISTPSESLMKQALDTFEKMDEVRTSQMMYRINTGLEMGIGDEIAVKFRGNVSQQQIEAIIHNYGLNMVKTSKIYNLLIVSKGGNALQIANEIQESGLALFSHPNFLVSAELYQDIPNDTYFHNQFYMHNTSQVFTDGHSGTFDADIDAPEAWTMTKGANSIIIAVIDEGISSDHPDLPNTRQVRLNGSNFADGDPNNPSPTNNQNHGNSSASIIAATRNNSQGITGIAPEKTIDIHMVINSE